ncbi:MAG: hypothetical protein IKJ13_02160 [Clostridia bacterium]|nr:hypothetical protein [Clostridia bacterium]MBR3805626.1 hypothetical protein [Clostridia bacterium]
MKETPDIGRIIQLIMENPSLVEEISRLASSDSENTASEAAAQPSPTSVEMTEAPTPPPTVRTEAPARAKRAQLLGALKPYVSAERAKAIDSMISVAEILDMMKAR